MVMLDKGIYHVITIHNVLTADDSKREEGIALDRRSVCVQADGGLLLCHRVYDILYQDGQDTTSNNSCHIYPTAQQADVY
jgi:hypothetical protein